MTDNQDMLWHVGCKCLEVGCLSYYNSSPHQEFLITCENKKKLNYWDTALKQDCFLYVLRTETSCSSDHTLVGKLWTYTHPEKTSLLGNCCSVKKYFPYMIWIQNVLSVLSAVTSRKIINLHICLKTSNNRRLCHRKNVFCMLLMKNRLPDCHSITGKIMNWHTCGKKF